jgi:DNA processing protein
MSACPLCTRRAWLLERLSIQLDFKARELTRLWSLLELPDVELMEALGGRRRAELRRAYATWRSSTAQDENEEQTICRHSTVYPQSLCGVGLAPHSLAVRGGIERLSKILEEPVVAIVGTRRASDYGMQTALGLGRGLGASGVTVASGLADGIPSAAHVGALEAHGRTLTVMAGELECCSPASCRALYRRISDSGCALSETPTSTRPHSWWQPARARTLALLADLVIVVEAREHPWELACAHVAQAHGKVVAAVPGRVSSPASRGANGLLMSGCPLVRSPQDVLDLLYGVGVREAGDPPTEAQDLEPCLQGVLEQVGDGQDTVAKLTRSGTPSGDVVVALAELELRGLLLRGDGGRYLCSARALSG